MIGLRGLRFSLEMPEKAFEQLFDSHSNICPLDSAKAALSNCQLEEEFDYSWKK